jgi:hypothetical protein
MAEARTVPMMLLGRLARVTAPDPVVAPVRAAGRAARSRISRPPRRSPRDSALPRGAAARTAGAAAGAAAAGGGSRRLTRGLLVTPWFAAGAGIVVAAALALNSPRDSLTFRPNTSRCGTCIEAGGLPPARPGVQIKSAHVDGGAARPAAPRPVVGFQVIRGPDGTFSETLTIPPGQARSGWRLSFRLPGRPIIQVWDAIWQPAGPWGGLASMPGDEGGPVGQSFQVFARGTPVRPSGCVLNGHACQFG